MGYNSMVCKTLLEGAGEVTVTIEPGDCPLVSIQMPIKPKKPMEKK